MPARGLKNLDFSGADLSEVSLYRLSKSVHKDDLVRYIGELRERLALQALEIQKLARQVPLRIQAEIPSKASISDREAATCAALRAALKDEL